MRSVGKLLAVCIILAACCGCEGSIVIRGQVISQRTGLPIDSALIQFVDRDVYTYSDASGSFELADFGGINLSEEFIIEKPNYKPFRMKPGSSGHYDSYLVYSEETFHDFPQPAYPNGPEDSSSFVLGAWVDPYSSAFAFADQKFTFRLDTADLAGELDRAYQELLPSR